MRRYVVTPFDHRLSSSVTLVTWERTHTGAEVALPSCGVDPPNPPPIHAYIHVHPFLPPKCATFPQ